MHLFGVVGNYIGYSYAHTIGIGSNGSGNQGYRYRLLEALDYVITHTV